MLSSYIEALEFGHGLRLETLAPLALWAVECGIPVVVMGLEASNASIVGVVLLPLALR